MSSEEKVMHDGRSAAPPTPSQRQLVSIEACTVLPDDIALWLASMGHIFREHPGHDSHCTSVALEQQPGRRFVKWSPSRSDAACAIGS